MNTVVFNTNLCYVLSQALRIRSTDRRAERRPSSLIHSGARAAILEEDRTNIGGGADEGTCGVNSSDEPGLQRGVKVSGLPIRWCVGSIRCHSAALVAVRRVAVALRVARLRKREVADCCEHNIFS